MTDPDDREFAVDLWVDSQADLLRPTGCEDPDAVARALWLSDLQVVPLADPAPVGLTEDERALRDFVDKCAKSAGDRKPVALQPFMCERVVRLIDRLSTAPRAEREALERIARQGRRKPSDTGLNAVYLAMIARDALAALPAPEPTLTGEETVNWYGLLRSAAAILPEVETPERLLVAARNLAHDIDAVIAPYPTSFDLPAAAPEPEGVPEDHRVCSHGIYHHGCPSCDRQDPEDR